MALDTLNKYKCHSCYEYFDTTLHKRFTCECGNSICRSCCNNETPCYFCGTSVCISTPPPVNKYDEDTDMKYIFIDTLEEQYEDKKKRNIWDDSEWKHIAELENNDVGIIGETTIHRLCKAAGINANINGVERKEVGGGVGDGTINGYSVEIKTARLGSSGSSFQHELGEKPWLADYMLFLDIAPDTFYITLFPNFTEEFYKRSGEDTTVKCVPIFPTKSICWRKRTGAFKLDTTKKINEVNSYCFKWYTGKNIRSFATFINSIMRVV